MITITAIVEKGRSGWVPLISVNGMIQGSSWLAKEYSQEEATGIANQMASDKAAQYVGDWKVEVKNV